MITAVIIDDEQHCIDCLTNLIESGFANVQIAATAASVEAGLNAIRFHQPALVFLDVQIADKTGFDLLLQLSNINFEVIFTTAYDKYAVQAFKFSALDYLLKPIDPSDLKQAIEKFENKHQAKETSARLDVLFHNLNNMQVATKRISVPVMNGFVFLNVSDIIH